MKEVEFERKVQDLRNKEYLDLKKKQKEEEPSHHGKMR